MVFSLVATLWKFRKGMAKSAAFGAALAIVSAGLKIADIYSDIALYVELNEFKAMMGTTARSMEFANPELANPDGTNSYDSIFATIGCTNVLLMTQGRAAQATWTIALIRPPPWQ